VEFNGIFDDHVNSKTMKKTAFNIKHHQSGARMVEFAGYEMPIEYRGINTEHLAVRSAAGLFDVSHMGEIWVKGPKASTFLSFVLSNDPRVLVPGKAQYTCLPNGKAGIVDDLIVHMFDAEKFLLVVNASNIQKDWQWLLENNSVGAILENASDQFSQLAIQGPNAIRILEELTDINLYEIQPFCFTTGTMGGLSNVVIAATGYTGSGGFEIYLDSPDPEPLWDSIIHAGTKYGLVPVGLAARDTLRLEMGYCLYGNDINDTTSPIEAGLGWITKFTDDRDFIDRPTLLRQKVEGVTRKLVGFEMVDRGIPRQHYPIFSKSFVQIGEVTSGTMSPSLKKGIGMGYVQTTFSEAGNEIYIEIRDKMLLARVVKMPFYKP
jgi:aminomethyltransferase